MRIRRGLPSKKVLHFNWLWNLSILGMGESGSMLTPTFLGRSKSWLVLAFMARIQMMFG